MPRGEQVRPQLRSGFTAVSEEVQCNVSTNASEVQALLEAEPFAKRVSASRRLFCFFFPWQEDLAGTNASMRGSHS